MNWIDVTWSINAGVCLTLSAVHLLVWLRDREAKENLVFSVWVTALAIAALLELALMHSPTREIYAEWLGRTALPYAVVAIAYIAFIRVYLQAGRWWLFWSVIGLIVLELLVKLTVLPTLPFAAITDLQRVPIWGETAAAPVGPKSSGQWLTGLLVMSELAFVGNAAVEAWRADRHRRVKIVAVALCGSTAFATAIAVSVMYAELPPPMAFSLTGLVTILVMAYGLSSDLLQARQLSRDLRQTQERMSLATNSVNLGIWDWDVERDEVWVTDNIRQSFRLSDNERLNVNNFFLKMHPDDRGEVEQLVRSGFGNKEDFNLEYRMMTANNEVRWIETRGRVERDAAGKLLHVRGVSHDVSERRQDEAEKAELRRALAQYNRVMQMTELSASLAHEINQPLGAVLNNAATAQMICASRQPKDEKIDEILQFIVQDTKRASDVIRNIRSMLQKEDVNVELLSINATIEEIIVLLRGNIKDNHISLVLNLQPGLTQFRGSRVGLQQVLINLITNALDAMQESSSRILNVTSSMSPPDMITVCVSDTGHGVDKTVATKIFQPFFTTKNDGLGMGLRICRSIIEEHDGRIWCENRAEGGARVCFSIPAYRGRAQ